MSTVDLIIGAMGLDKVETLSRYQLEKLVTSYRRHAIADTLETLVTAEDIDAEMDNIRDTEWQLLNPEPVEPVIDYRPESAIKIPFGLLIEGDVFDVGYSKPVIATDYWTKSGEKSAFPKSFPLRSFPCRINELVWVNPTLYELRKPR